jgi:hypothetical protein
VVAPYPDEHDDGDPEGHRQGRNRHCHRGERTSARLYAAER